MVEAASFLDLLGEPQDDYDGLLTKRMLLLLESRVLVGEPAHSSLIGRVVDAYWQNEDLHPNDYLPIVLVNDIVRYWRIVLLNHEWKLRKKDRELTDDAGLDRESARARLLAERRYRSYKLRFPRCLTCFSALTHLLALTPGEPAHVSKADVLEMIALTPIERLRRLPKLAAVNIGPRIDEMLSLYARYLERNSEGKDQLLDTLRRDPETQESISKDGRAFTTLMFGLVQELGGGRPLHRHMLV